jgi:hypothetical protein
LITVNAIIMIVISFDAPSAAAVLRPAQSAPPIFGPVILDVNMARVVTISACSIAPASLVMSLTIVSASSLQDVAAAIANAREQVTQGCIARRPDSASRELFPTVVLRSVALGGRPETSTGLCADEGVLQP